MEIYLARYYLRRDDRVQDDCTELVRLLIKAEADPTTATSKYNSRRGPETPLGWALDELGGTGSGSPQQVISFIPKHICPDHNSHII
jgi:hypothetical protein